MTQVCVIPPAVLAALPHDAIGTRDDWRRAGASERMFRDGRLRRVAYGIYVPADDERPLTAQRMAALLPDDCVIGGWAAAAAFGVRDAGPTMMSTEPDRLLAYPGRHMHKKLPGFRTLRSDVAEHEIVTIDGVRMTNLLRTAYDMVRFTSTLVHAIGLLDCFRYALNPAPLDEADLWEVVEARPRARGNARVRAALRYSSSRSRSIAESELRARVMLGGGAGPILTNATLLHDGVPYELDLVDVDSGLVLEYDSKFHMDTAQRHRDSRKDVAVDEAGLVMLRVNSPLLYAPAELAATVARRRGTARGRGSDRRVRELLARGDLAERPLRP